MTDTEERPIITEVQVRAVDLRHRDMVKLQGVYIHTWDPTSGRWSDDKLHTNALWRWVYDVGNEDGDSSIQDAEAALNDSFTLLRVSADGPNEIDHPDWYIAVQNHQLVTVQHENRSF